MRIETKPQKGPLYHCIKSPLLQASYHETLFINNLSTQKSTHLIERLVLILIEARFSILISSLKLLYYLYLLLLHFRLLNFSTHLPFYSSRSPGSFCVTFPFFILNMLYSSCFQQISSNNPDTYANALSKTVKQNYHKNHLLRNIISNLRFIILLDTSF